MKMTILCAGPAAPHAGWVAIDELAFMLARLFDAELLSPMRLPPSLLERATGRQRPRFAPLDCDGGDVLMVVAHSPSDLAMINAIPEVKKRFSRILGFVTDSYFQAGFLTETTQYDAITVTAHEDAAPVQQRFGIPVHQLYQGTDALSWTPMVPHARDIDLIAFGRTPPSYHQAFSHSFHQAASPYLYLHSPLGHLSGSDVHLERGMLFKLLQRTRISLAFHLFVEPQGNRPRSMMVTSRWLESLTAGCIVAGKRPISRMASDMLDWQGCTVELPDQADEAVDVLHDLLAQHDQLQAQRQENMRQMLLRHDWRYRIMHLCALFDWPIPELLHQELGELQNLASRLT